LFSEAFSVVLRTFGAPSAIIAPMEGRMRTEIAAALIAVVAFTMPTSAQTSVDSFQLLQSVVKPGDMVIVTDDAGRETSGLVTEVSSTSLTLALRKQQRVFAENTVRGIRRTDSLGNGTLAGLAVGIAATSAFAVRCGKYQYSEESGPCMAAAMSSGLLWIPIAALIGRAIDRAHGNTQIYQR
jgi:hypothetical protein